MAQKLYRVVETRWVGGNRVESDLGCAWKPEAKAREEMAECQALRMIPIVRGENGVALGESELKFVGADTQFSGRFAREAPPVKH
jgi:hypothetical protein